MLKFILLIAVVGIIIYLLKKIADSIVPTNPKPSPKPKQKKKSNEKSTH